MIKKNNKFEDIIKYNLNIAQLCGCQSSLKNL